MGSGRNGPGSGSAAAFVWSKSLQSHLPEANFSLWRSSALEAGHLGKIGLKGAASEMLESSPERRVVSSPCNTASRAGLKESSDAAGEYTCGTVTPNTRSRFPV
jgi:hypothetical protein